MTNLALTTMIAGSLGFAAVSASASGHEQAWGKEQDYRIAFNWRWFRGLADEINHLNRMRGHVRWLFHNYRSKPQLRRDFFTVSHDIDRINAEFKQKKFDGRRLRRDVAKAHNELHRLEIALRAKPRDYYPWR